MSFPLGIARRGDAVQGLRHHHRRLQRVLRLLRRAVHARARAHAAGRRHPRRGAAWRPTPGAREVQLLGQIVNHYQAPDDPGCDFAALLERLNDVDGLERIRFASPHPRHVTPRMIAAMRDLPEGLPAPAPAGAVGLDAVLAAMRRRHTREDYLELVDRLREAMPDIALSTDMIVGFPGETDEDFDDTLSLTARSGFTACSRSSIRARPNTLALKRMPDDVPEEEKTRRIVALQALQKRIQGELFSASGRAGRDGARRRDEPPARLGAVGPHDRQHGRELPGEPALDRPASCRSGSPARIRTACEGSRGLTPPGGLRLSAAVSHGPTDRKAATMQIEMTIKGLMVDPITNMPIIILRDKDGAAGAADLGRGVRGQRHRAADRERDHAAADDARPAAERHSRPQGGHREDRGLAT